MKKITILLIGLLFWGTSDRLFAETRYVTAGSATSLQTHWNALQDNDVLSIPNGTYTITSGAFFELENRQGVTIQGASKSGTIIDFDGHEGFNVSGCDIDFEYLTIKNASTSAAVNVHALYNGSLFTSTVNFDNVRFESNSSGCIEFEKFLGVINTWPIIIQDCEFVNNVSSLSCAGICITDVSDNLIIQRNYFSGNTSTGGDGCDISIAEVSANLTIENNVFHSSSGAPSIYLNGSSSGKTLSIKNNTIAKSNAGGLKFGSTFSGYTKSFNNNMFADNTSYDISGSLTLSGDYNIVENVSGTTISGSNNDIGTSASYFKVVSGELDYTNYGADVAIAKISSSYPTLDANGEARDGMYCDIGGLNVPLDTLTLWTGAGNNHTWTNSSNWYRGVPANSTNYKRVDIFDTNSSNYPIITSNTSLNNVRFKVKSKSILKNSTTMTCKSIRVKSDDDGDGQFIDAGNMTVSGEEIYEQQLIGGQWNFIGIPADVTAQNLLPDYTLTTHYWLASYNGSQRADLGMVDNWEDITLPGYTLKAKNGYIIWVDSDITIEFTSRPVLTSVDVTMYSGSGGYNNEGWNLVGNPYSIAIESDKVAASNSSVIRGAVYLSNGTDYDTRVGGIGSADIIPGHQAFFVQSDPSGVFNFFTSAAVYSLDNQFKSNELKSYVTVVASDNRGNQDEAYVRIKSDATEDFDAQYDAYEFITPSNLLLYTSLKGIDYSVNSISLNELQSVVPLHMKLSDGADRFSFAISTEAFEDYRVVLYDNRLNKQTVITDGDSLSFDVDDSDLDTRFELRFYPDVVTPIGEQASVDGVVISDRDGGIDIAINTTDAISIAIIDVSGRLLFQESNINSGLSIDLPKAGLYLVKVSDGAKKFTYKHIHQ